MKTLRRSMVLVAGRVVSDAFQFLLYVAIVRRFTEFEIGDYSFAFALAAVLGMLVGLGTRSLVTREVTNDHSLGAAYPVNLLALHGVLSLIVGLGLLVWGRIADFSASLTAMCVLAFVAAGLTSTAFSAVAVVDASGRVERGAVAEVIGKASTVLLGFAALLAGYSLPVIMGAQVAGALVYLALAMRWASRSFGPLAWRLDFRLILRTVRAAMPFALAALFYSLYARIDIIMLHQITGAAETGYYAVAYRIVETSFVVASMVGIAMFPELSAGGIVGSADRRRLFGGSVRWLAVLGAAMSVAIFIAGDQLATLLFGPDFAAAGDLLRMMALLIVIGYIKEPLWRLLIAQRREKLQLYIQGTSILLNVVLNAILITLYGALGAVAASLISESLMLAAFSVTILKLGWIDFRTIAGWLVAVLLASVAGALLRYMAPPLVAGGAAAALLACLFVALRVIRLEEIPVLRRLVTSSPP